MPAEYDDTIAALAWRAAVPPVVAPLRLVAERLELIDALARLFEAQTRGAPAAFLSPIVAGATFGGGARVPGSSLELDPPQAAYAIGWLMGDARLGALLPLADWLARLAVLAGEKPPRVLALLEAVAQARELAAALRLPMPAAELPLGPPLATRVAVAAVAMRLLGGDVRAIAAAISLAFADGLAPHDGDAARACAAAAASGVRAALLAHAGAPPVPQVLSARPAGFEAALLGGARITLAPAEVETPPPATDELLAWHRFELAVQGRFNARGAERVLKAVNATVDLDAMPLQSFVAQLVRAA